jgi:hypothetical protein
MRPYPVVVPTPLLDQHLGFPQRVEHLAVQQFIAQLDTSGIPTIRRAKAAGWPS